MPCNYKSNLYTVVEKKFQQIITLVNFGNLGKISLESIIVMRANR